MRAFRNSRMSSTDASFAHFTATGTAEIEPLYVLPLETNEDDENDDRKEGPTHVFWRDRTVCRQRRVGRRSRARSEEMPRFSDGRAT